MSAPRVEQAPSPNWDERGGAAVDLVVLHYTGMADGAAALRRLCDPAPRLGAYASALAPAHRDGALDQELARVSAHYVVETDGRVFQLVAEDQRAWHAGVAFWAGAANINARSIGIEIVNGGHEFPDARGRPPPYPEAQIAAVVALVADIAARRRVPPWRVVGHSDVAPGRKIDPGEHFPWLALDQRGLALSAGLRLTAADRTPLLRTGDAGPAVRALQRRLLAFGYGVAESGGYDARTVTVASAFQRRFPLGEAHPLEGRVWTAGDDAALRAAFARARELAGTAQPPFPQEPPADPHPA